MNLRFGQYVDVEAVPVDEDGNPAEIEAGTAVWKSSDESIATVEEHPDFPGDELKRRVRASGTNKGSAAITLEADGDPTGDVATILASGAVNVFGKNATGVDLKFGEAQSDSDTGEDGDGTETPA